MTVTIINHLEKKKVGELVRYLLSAPPSPNDRKHQIRLIWGNGLSPELWKKLEVRGEGPSTTPPRCPIVG